MKGEEKPLPETFFDDYATRSDAARKQEMRVADDLMMGYDLKLTPPDSSGSETPKEATDRRWWRSGYDRMTKEEKEAWDAAYAPDNAAFRKSGLKGEDLARWKYQRYIKDYLRCIASVDENVGKVLDYLDAEGLARNTIVIYTSDQGFYLGEHGWFDKRFMYEESLRMPLLLRYPAEIKPGVISSMVLNIDFAPTFLDYAGAGHTGQNAGTLHPKCGSRNTPRRLAAVDVLPLLRIPGRACGQAALWHTDEPVQADPLLLRHRRLGALRSAE